LVTVGPQFSPYLHICTYNEERNEYGVLVGKPEGKIYLRRRRRRWEDNIKIFLKEIALR